MQENEVIEEKKVEVVSEEKLYRLGKLSRLENKLFRRNKLKNVFKRTKLLSRINHYRVLLEMDTKALTDF